MGCAGMSGRDMSQQDEFKFRIPGADAPDFAAMLQSLEVMTAALRRVEATAKKGQMPASKDILALADVLVFFSTDNDKDAARERIMRYSLNEYIAAVSALMPAQTQAQLE